MECADSGKYEQGSKARIRVQNKLKELGSLWYQTAESIGRLNEEGTAKYEEYAPLIEYLENMALTAENNNEAKAISKDFNDLKALVS